MRMTSVKTNETSVSALAKRLYPNLNDSSLKKAEAALLKANPHLAEDATLKPGATVVLPAIPGVKPNPSAGEDPVDTMLSHLQEATDDYQKILATRLEATATDLANQEEILKNREVTAAIKASPEAAEMAKDLTANLRVRKKELADSKKTQEALFSLIKEDLAKMFK